MGSASESGSSSHYGPQTLIPPAPVFRLPYELLETIFQYTVCSEATQFFPDSFSSLTLSHVCHCWRVVAQSSPRLWSIDLLDCRDLSLHLLPFIQGGASPLHVICSHQDSRPRAWPRWLYEYVRDGGVREISVKICMSGFERFLRTVREDLPDLQWLDLHGSFQLGLDYLTKVRAPMPFLRSLTMSYHPPNASRQMPVYVLLSDPLALLHLSPSLRAVCLDYVHIGEHPRDTIDLQAHGPLPLQHVRRWTFTGVNRLHTILASAAMSPTHSTVEIDDVGSLNLGSEFAKATRTRLKQAQHTHLSVTTSVIETFSAVNTDSVYRFSRIKRHQVLFHNLVSFGRAFQWSACITHLTLNPDGRMFSTFTHDGQPWDEVLAGAWGKFIGGLGSLVQLKIAGFVAHEVFHALCPQQVEKARVVKTRIPCPRLETLVVNDFALSFSSADPETAGGLAPLLVDDLLGLLVARKKADRPITRLILCHCLDFPPAREILSAIVPNTDVR